MNFALLIVALLAPRAWAAPISIAEVKHEGDVDFEREILPMLRRNCLACHSATEAQGDLVLESPQTILKGGSTGPAAVAGKSGDSLILKLASRQKEPHMPPPDNDVKAKALTPDELGLMKLWIDQGAKGEVKAASTQIAWQPLPPGINPIYAAAITADGQYAAASRANQIFLYHVPSRRELGRLTDPALLAGGVYKQPGVADLDLVQSLKFSPDGTLLASGGFRTVKLWRRPEATKLADLPGERLSGRSLAIAPGGRLVAVGDDSGNIHIYDLVTRRIAHTLRGHTAAVTAAAFAADGRLVSGSQDKSFRVWNLRDPAPVVVETPSPIQALTIVSTGRQVATGGEDGILRLWDLPASQPPSAPRPVKELAGHNGPIRALAAIDLQGSQMVSGGQDGTARVWNVASGEALQTVNHGAPLTAVAASPAAKRLATAGAASAKLWNAEDGKPLAELKGNLRAALKVSERTRAAALAKKHIDLAKKDLEDANNRKKAEEDNHKKSGEALTKAEGEFKTKADAAQKATEEKSAADKALADATAAKTRAEESKKAAADILAKADEALKSLQASAAAAAKIAGEDAQAAKAAAEKAAGEITALRKLLEPGEKAAAKAAEDATSAFTAAEKKAKDVAGAHQKAADEQTAAQRTLDTAKRGVERAVEAVKKATDAIPAADALVKQAEQAAKAREAEVAAATAAAKDSEQAVHSVAFSPSGRFLASTGDDGLVHLWDAETGAAREVFGNGKSALAAVTFLEDGLAIAAGAGGGALWEVATEWRLVRALGSADDPTIFSDRVTALDFSPDGKLLAVGSGEPSRSGEVKLFEVATGKPGLALKDPHSDTVNCVAFSPDGQQLASTSADRFLKLWNVADGKFIRALEGHTHHVLAAAWRADGRMLVSSGADMVLKVWDPRTGDQLRTVQNQFTKEVTSVSLVADDQFVASSGDAKVRLINAANGNNQRDFGGASEYMYSVAASADGKTIIAGGLDGVLRIWSDDGKEVAKFAAPPSATQQTAAK